MLRKMRALTPLIALACMAGMLFPVAAQAANGVCLGRKHTAAGTQADDPLPGGSVADVIAGLEGNDAIAGVGGDDRLCGGPGDDYISGDDGADLLRGNAGNDVLLGGAGADRYNGGPGTDICDFGPGDRSSGGCEMSFEDDADRDGLSNGAELLARSNPFVKDAGEVEEVVEGLHEEGLIETDSDNTQAAVDVCADATGTPDLDRDGTRDECDEDLDGDMIVNGMDLCPTRMHGDPNYGGCPPLVPGDSDSDGVVDYPDNCRDDWNPEQTDTDGDGVGDVCDAPDLPTFFEFYDALVSLIGPCPLGPVICEIAVLALYQAIYGVPPPPYTLPPGFFGGGAPCMIIIICGIGGIGGIGGIDGIPGTGGTGVTRGAVSATAEAAVPSRAMSRRARRSPLTVRTAISGPPVSFGPRRQTRLPVLRSGGATSASPETVWKVSVAP